MNTTMKTSPLAFVRGSMPFLIPLIVCLGTVAGCCHGQRPDRPVSQQPVPAQTTTAPPPAPPLPAPPSAAAEPAPAPPPPPVPTAEKPAAPAPEAPVRPTTKTACDACRGRWGIHGLAETKSCVCRTKDGGKICRDGSDCSALCIADEKKFEVKEAGPPPRGYYVGKCSTYDTVFGCFKLIPNGIRSKPPQIQDEAADSICID
jgi:hypothetical protein